MPTFIEDRIHFGEINFEHFSILCFLTPMTKLLKKFFIARKLFAFLFVFILLELKVCYRAYDFETNLQNLCPSNLGHLRTLLEISTNVYKLELTASLSSRQWTQRASIRV